MTTKFRMQDTKQANGCYVSFSRLTHFDEDASPLEYLFQDEDYREADQARLDAWHIDEWSFIGIQAVATVRIVMNGCAIEHRITSGGLWAIESDSGEDYLTSVYNDEVASLKSQIEAMQAPIYS